MIKREMIKQNVRTYALHFLFNVDEVQIDEMAANDLFRTRSI